MTARKIDLLKQSSVFQKIEMIGGSVSIYDLPRECIGLIVERVPIRLRLVLLFLRLFSRHVKREDFKKKKDSFSHTEDLANSCAKYGYVSLLEWSVKFLGYLLGPNIYMWAAHAGQLGVLKWLVEPIHERGEIVNLASRQAKRVSVPWDGWTCAEAAAGGQLEVLQWLREGEGSKGPNGPAPWDAWTCDLASQRGYLHILKWARDPSRVGGPAPWNENVCANASLFGFFEMLKWAREGSDTPCPWDDRVCSFAVSAGFDGSKRDELCFEAIKWLTDPKRAGGPAPWCRDRCLESARGWGEDVLSSVREEMLDWIIENLV